MGGELIPPKKNKSEDYYIKKIRQYLDISVKKMVDTDSSVGVFLSGGLDSSAIVAYAKKYKNDLKTFSIGFDDPKCDESNYFRHVAQEFKTDHHEIFVKSEDVIKLLPNLIKKIDEPFGDPSLIPTHILSTAAKKSVNICLSGEGGDESFFGYDQYKQFKVIQLQRYFYNKMVQYTLRTIFDNLPQYLDNNLIMKLKNYNEMYGLSDQEKYIELRSRFKKNIRKRLFKLNSSYSVSMQKYFLSDDYLYNMNLCEIKTYLSEWILKKLDQATMLSGLEGRVPFLDHNFFEFSRSIPNSLKLKGFQTKYILRKSLRGILPSRIIKRKKQAFLPPLQRYFNNGLKSYMKNNLLEKSDLHNYVNPRYLKKIIRMYYSNGYDLNNGLWNLLFLKMWLEQNKSKLIIS